MKIIYSFLRSVNVESLNENVFSLEYILLRT